MCSRIFRSKRPHPASATDTPTGNTKTKYNPPAIGGPIEIYTPG
jgi:hypothetical protein